MSLLGIVNLLKEAWLACAPLLFYDFDNKDKIMQRIKDTPLSRNTIKERILKLAGNVTDQQKIDINSAPFISLCLDESTDVTKSARLAVLRRKRHKGRINCDNIVANIFKGHRYLYGC
ncbi:hypothetical protein AVEN_27187-1 [Araneus ventricosus]|uniref:DUF4371 domain-containing protein n=1 Tax=Araneus ventricosus TaxID=182803 RepID=A0A4Y2CX76_ARAVE|nr:hypothetical protein AVEN_27187-1 [Araneus ventricosus]